MTYESAVRVELNGGQPQWKWAVQKLLDEERERDSIERELLCAQTLARSRFMQAYIPKAFGIERFPDTDIVVCRHLSLWGRLKLAWVLLTKPGWDMYA